MVVFECPKYELRGEHLIILVASELVECVVTLPLAYKQIAKTDQTNKTLLTPSQC